MGEPRRASTRRGFTLIEILAVLVIVGVVTGLVVYSMHSLDGRSDQGQAAEKLAGLVQLAGENARLENIQYGLKIEPHKYEFLRFSGGGWAPVTNDPALSAHALPDSLTLSVTVRNPIHVPAPATAARTSGSAATAMAAAAATGSGGGTEALTPQIAILSTGEMTPFTMRLSAPDGTTYVLRGDGNGQIHVQPPGSAAGPATMGGPAPGAR